MANARKMEDHLWKCYLQTFGRDGAQKMYYDWAYSALSWWINSGRSSLVWDDAFCKANPKALMKRLARRSNSTDGYIKEATSYLQRYCGLVKGR